MTTSSVMTRGPLMALLVAGVVVLARPDRASAGEPGSDQVVPQATRWVMGTYLRVVVVDPQVSPNRAAAAMDAAFEAAERWDDLLSNYDPYSPLSDINRNAGEWVSIPDELYTYLGRAKLAARRTGGVFDITVGGLALGDSPDDRVVVGSKWLDLEKDGSRARARLRHRSMALDPGGDGKGWAVDAMVDVLREAGVEQALIEFGGSSWYAMGRPPAAESWQIEVADAGDRIVATAHLVDRALSTSRAARRDSAPIEDADRSDFHILDPRTGARVYADRTVAVVADRATDAEVLSTALVVIGTQGFDFLDQFEGAAALVVDGEEPPVVSESADVWLRVGEPTVDLPPRGAPDRP